MWQGLEGGEGRGANVLLSGGTAILCDGVALRDSRSAGSVYGDGYPLMCICMCVRRGSGRVCLATPYGPW